MSDGSGCNHRRLVKSFKVPTSLECEQCGKIELRILRGRVYDLNVDKSGLLKIISGLQDEIDSDVVAVIAKAQAVVDARNTLANWAYDDHGPLYTEAVLADMQAHKALTNALKELE
jgi:hypothetical protein